MSNLSSVIKSIQDIMRQDSGVDGDAQRISQLTWLLFLKVFDALEEELELTRDDYKSPIPEAMRWRNWATDAEGITGDALLDFVNNQLFATLKSLSGDAQRNPRGYVVRGVFEDAYNYMKSGQLLRQVINKLNAIDFNRQAERHQFNDLYEKILKDLQSAGNAGEFYTPRAVTQFMVDMVNPQLGERVMDPATGTGGFLVCAIEHLRKQVHNTDEEATLQNSILGVEKKQMPHMLCVGTLTQSETPEALADNWQRIATHFDVLLDRPEAVDALEQTILQLAVRGLLVPQDPTDEPASVLLQKIRTEKDHLIAQGKIKRDKPLPPITDEEKPFELPKGWEWARFPELGEFGRGKSKHRPRNDPALFNPPIYPVVQTGEVARAKGVIQAYHSKYSEIGLAQSRLWPEGTLCITIAANIADAALLGFDACFPDSVVGFVPAQTLGNAKYFLAFMETARNELIKFAPATAQKNINLEILGALLIPVPPLTEMSRIVTRVNELRSLCADLRQRLSAGQAVQSHLADALVTG
jgi:hypothetical protein